MLKTQQEDKQDMGRRKGYSQGGNNLRVNENTHQCPAELMYREYNYILSEVREDDNL